MAHGRFFRDRNRNQLRRGVFTAVEKCSPPSRLHRTTQRQPKPFIWTAKATRSCKRSSEDKAALLNCPSAVTHTTLLGTISRRLSLLPVLATIFDGDGVEEGHAARSVLPDYVDGVFSFGFAEGEEFLRPSLVGDETLAKLPS